ncbi:SEC-C metal-binding domain-containing protein [Mycobacterium celatum]|uniref:SEC-C metal-binding domain-containing protein n=2 Tax=Mycobacterium celatum TaxID=28045 RepID=UPI003B75C24E
MVVVADAPGETLAGILAEHGPLHEDDIARRLRENGVADPDAVLKQLHYEIDFPARQLVDERWVWLPPLMTGRVLTHRIAADELAHDILNVCPDLEPITTLCEHAQYQRFADGSPAPVVMVDYDDELLEERGIPDEAVAEGGALLLAPGTLAGLSVAEGDLVGVQLTEQGLAAERVSETADSPVGERLVAMLDADEPTYLNAAVWTACVEDPAWFTEPLPPLCEIVDDHGLARCLDWVAPAGFDFDSWRLELRCALLAERHDLDPDDAFALYTLVKLYEQISALVEAAEDELPADSVAAAGEDAETPEDDEFTDLLGELGAALADPRLADLLVAETVGVDSSGAPALGLFADVLEPKVPRAARVACRWLRAVALERIGDIEAAERELLTAESMDPEWPLPLRELARIASDRGHVERGLALLRRAGAEPDHPLVELLERYRPEPRTDLGRNEPCWCGSGRKYKKCHLGREQLPLAERAKWLYAKAIQHVLLSGWDDLLAKVGYERCRYTDDDPDVLEDPLVLDAVLFEGGAFEEFLEIRGSLLPDDERLLAEQWLLAERSVFEIEGVQPGRSVTLRDVRTGDTQEVQERTASRQLKPGQLICARPIPVGDDTMQFFGGLEPVALHQRDRLIDLLDTEPDAAELVAELSRRFAPPMLVNSEGDPLAICEATVRVSDPDRIQDQLDDTYDRVDGEEPPQWFEYVEIQGLQRLRASMSLEGGTLDVATSSENRMDRVLATLARLDPEMKVLDDFRRPVRDARDAAELAEEFGVDDEDELDDDDPKVAAALQEFIRDYETKWLDQPIPALDGHTPRQAADDPTRRGDLIKLLDSFPSGAAARACMDVDRLRAALGL